MRFLWISAIALTLSACANGPNREFVATPVPDEISSVIYSIETSSGSNTWQLTNNDLRIKYSSKPRGGKVNARQAKKMTPNEYNWVAYNLEKANFTKVKSASSTRQSKGNEVLTIVTQADFYTFTQNSSSKFPNGFQSVVDVIPGLSNP